MNKHLVSIALVAVLATMAAGCQKENIMELNPQVSEMSIVRTVGYSIDGQNFQAVLTSDAEWDAFVDNLLTLSEQGHDIYIEGNGTRGLSTKDTQTITTDDKKVAKDWAKEKQEEGYGVAIHNDNGEYTVIAVK